MGDALAPLIKIESPPGTKRLVRGFVDEEMDVGDPTKWLAQRLVLLDDERPSHRWRPRLLGVRESYDGRIRRRTDACRWLASAAPVLRYPINNSTHPGHLGYSNGRGL